MTMNKGSFYHKENLSCMVEDYIREMILRGTYKEGDRILEADIAQKLGISRGPVREGMKAAEQSGILTVESRKGASVTQLSEDDIQDVFEIRVMLESSMLEKIINHNLMEERDFQALDQIVREMEEIARSSIDEDERILALNKKDIEFHQYVWKKSGSKRRERILNDIFFQLRLAMLYDTKVTKSLVITASDHYKIIQCLREKDFENCKRALTDHIITY